MSEESYVDEIRLGPQMKWGVGCHEREVQRVLEQERYAISQDLRDATKGNEAFAVCDADYRPLDGAYKIMLDISDLGVADNHLVLTLLGPDGREKLERYEIDLARSFLGAAGMRIQVCRVWGALSKYTAHVMRSGALDMHIAFDEARKSYHTYFEDMIGDDLSNGTAYKFSEARDLCRQAATGLLVFTPFFRNDYDETPTANPWPKILANRLIR